MMMTLSMDDLAVGPHACVLAANGCHSHFALPKTEMDTRLTRLSRNTSIKDMISLSATSVYHAQKLRTKKLKQPIPSREAFDYVK